MESDVVFNSIFDEHSGGTPKFVTDHEGVLSQKRKLAPEVRCFRILCFSTSEDEVRCAC